MGHSRVRTIQILNKIIYKKVDYQDGKQAASLNQIIFCETSCKDNDDVTRINQEEQEKWIKRREKEFKQENKQIPLQFSYILGKIIQKQGYDVIYNPEIDCDDLLANLAFHDNGVVISQDKDMFRYQGQKKGKNYDFLSHQNTPFRTLSQFKLTVFNIIDKNYFDSRLEEIQNLDQNQFPQRIQVNKKKSIQTRRIDEKKADFTTFDQQDPFIYEMKNFEKQYFGVGSSLCKKYGNIYKHTQEIRQALYYELGIQNPKTEIIIEWDQQQQTQVWSEYIVTPQKNQQILDNFLHYLIENKKFVSFYAGISQEEYYQTQHHNINIYIISLLYYCIYKKISIVDFDNEQILRIQIPKFNQNLNYADLDPLQILKLSPQIYDYSNRQVQNLSEEYIQINQIEQQFKSQLIL
ncbi:hypothetical protein PPERSA_09155 [Pseudocohnilembus persalinus]|uniref:PIN domain-like protein n=1 Tax=Pseudocohnilembus persalinus TaxID=266149 RepID=A0A0V0QX64_PSEPJ|nr:hypothetical protein PPERSA_09155 [Pseudocohnilembus persalinus]|eukprot:KRX06753.1 hypothetical protein PPERSA_09155 [Pseudocohnilembus persalinus]